MDKNGIKASLGYLWLRSFLENMGIKTFPYYRESYLLKQGNNRTIEKPEVTQYFYKQKQVNDDLWSNMEFALKHEGINLSVIEQIFNVINPEEVKTYVQNNKKGKYNRIIWFLYEWITGNRLDIEDVDTRIYFELLDTKIYYTSKPINHKRYAIKENLLGNKNFCPMVRKNQDLTQFDSINLKDKIVKVLDQFDPELIHKANAYLYFKETKSSFEIEREKPDQARLTRLANTLETLDNIEDLSKDLFIEFQNLIVAPKDRENDYRTWQNYVGESILDFEKVHYISPKGENVSSLMNGLIECYNRMVESNLPPVLIATVLSFGFVFIHPFEDGNGRIHRFLIHYVLSKLHITAPGIVFPISSTILQKLKDYDKQLESFSKPLVKNIDYDLDANRLMSVKEETIHFYKYIDMTNFVDYLYRCILNTIDVSYMEELQFMSKYDKTKKEMQTIIDMPDNQINLFIKICIENNGNISKNKRNKFFSELSDDEITTLENTYQKYFFNNLN